MDRMCELYIDTYADLFFYSNMAEHNVLFHVIKEHLIKRINIFKDELLAVCWAPERIDHFRYDFQSWENR